MLKIFQKICLRTKNAINHWVFNIYFSFIWSVNTPLVLLWVNIDTGGHKTSTKSQKTAVGPHKTRYYQDPNPLVRKG